DRHRHHPADDVQGSAPQDQRRQARRDADRERQARADPVDGAADRLRLPPDERDPDSAGAAAALPQLSARAGIVVTGTEVLTGRVRDANGPWLADRLLELGIELAHVSICGDRPEDMEAQLRFMRDQGVDLIVTSGGLGPTADDLTAEVVGEFCGREMVLDEALEARIAEILKPLLARWPQLDQEAVRESNRKQAVIPEGATVIDPVGTAPGLVVPAANGSGPTVVVLPGPPRELQPMWRSAVGTEAFTAAVGGATTYRQTILRLFGIPESEI